MSSDEGEKISKKGTAIRGAIDLQRMKLEKLMKNPDKPAFIPEKPKNKRFQDAPEFVRNVMGSSAGAGSGEFHVYRHIRRREYSRQEFLQHKMDKELLDEAYHQKLEENKAKLDQKTAKKRAKRHKRKEAIKAKRLRAKQGIKAKQSSESESESETEEKEASNGERLDKNNESKFDDKLDSNSSLDGNVPKKFKNITTKDCRES